MEGISQVSNSIAMASSPLGGASASISAGFSSSSASEKPVVQPEGSVLNEKVVRQMVQEGNQALKAQGVKQVVSFGYEAKLGELFVQIRDGVTGSVVGEFPSRDVRASRIAMREMVGLILDKQG